MKDPHAIIKSQIITEKGTEMATASNQYQFRVAPGANKIEVRTAVEKIFSVKVLDVQMMNYMGKIKRRGAFSGRKSGWKKAIVRLPKEQKINLA